MFYFSRVLALLPGRNFAVVLTLGSPTLEDVRANADILRAAFRASPTNNPGQRALSAAVSMLYTNRCLFQEGDKRARAKWLVGTGWNIKALMSYVRQRHGGAHLMCRPSRLALHILCLRRRLKRQAPGSSDELVRELKQLIVVRKRPPKYGQRIEGEPEPETLSGDPAAESQDCPATVPSGMLWRLRHSMPDVVNARVCPGSGTCSVCPACPTATVRARSLAQVRQICHVQLRAVRHQKQIQHLA